MNIKVKCACGCKTSLVIQEISLESLDLSLDKTCIESITIKEKEAIKIINFLTKWIDQQRIMNNEKIREKQNA